MSINDIDFIIDDERKEMEIYIQSKKEFVFTIKDLLILLKGNKDLYDFDITSIKFEKVKEIEKINVEY